MWHQDKSQVTLQGEEEGGEKFVSTQSQRRIASAKSRQESCMHDANHEDGNFKNQEVSLKSSEINQGFERQTVENDGYFGDGFPVLTNGRVEVDGEEGFATRNTYFDRV